MKGIYLGSLLGVRVNLHPFVLALFLGMFFLGNFFEFLVIFVLIFLHELAHLVVANMYGFKVKEMEIFLFGGVGRIDSLLWVNPGKEINIALAGPGINLFFALLGLGIKYLFFSASSELAFFVTVNLQLALINLLPALPLDGGRIFRSMAQRWFNIRQSTIMAKLFGYILSLMLIVLSLFSFFRNGWSLTIPILMATGIFLGYAAKNEPVPELYLSWRYQWQAKMKKANLKISWFYGYHDNRAKDFMPLFKPHTIGLIVILDDRGNMVDMVSEGVLLYAIEEYGWDVKIKEIKSDFTS